MPASGPTRSGASPGGSTPGPGTSSTWQTGAPWRAPPGRTRTTCWRRSPASSRSWATSPSPRAGGASPCASSCTSSRTSTSHCTWAGRRIAAGTSSRCWRRARETNLHALWDGEPLRLPGGPGPRDRARSLPGPAPDEARRWQAASPADWARESQALRRQVYGFRRGRDPTALPAAYLAAARSTVDRRLVQAGVRLAGRLNAVLGPGSPCPGEVASGQSNL